MLFLLFISAILHCCHGVDKCPTQVESSQLVTSQVIADMKHTLEMSKQFMYVMDHTVHGFVVDLETKMQVGSRLLENNLFFENQGSTCKEECKATASTAARTPRAPANLPKWQGPPTSCAKIVNVDNTEMFLNITDYPNKVAEETDLLGGQFNGKTKKITVRPGCMATLWQRAKNMDRNADIEERDLLNIEHDEYDVKTLSAGTVDMEDQSDYGLSRVECMCDPLRTEPNATQERNDCTKFHIFNEETQRCEWTLDSNICGVVSSSEGVSKRLRIPNWPLNKRYDVNLRLAGMSDFNEKVSTVSVRNGCFATMYNEHGLNSDDKTLETVGYGEYSVKEKTVRVVCECLNDDSNSEKFVIATPAPPNCIDNHYFNETTQRCEWIGRDRACVELTNENNEKMSLGELTQGNTYDDIYLTSEKYLEKWNDKVVKAVVRNGCMATFWSHSNAVAYETTILETAEYGEYEIAAAATGNVGANGVGDGLSSVTCNCDGTRTQLPASDIASSTKQLECLPNHELDKATGICEWTLEKNICGEIQTSGGVRMMLEIRNWPRNKRYDVNLVHDGLYMFANKHCFASLLTGTLLNSYALNGRGFKGYGNYTATEAVERVVCECMY